MKKSTYLMILFLTIISLSACDSWLELEPNDRVDDTKLFNSYEGFRNSLNGIYKSISMPELYGREMTWGTASVIGQDYLSGSSGTSYYYQYMQKYDYGRSSIKSIISKCWSKAYNAIANCNKLIQEIERKDGSFFPEGLAEKNMILGEALALRGFLHFDMLRLFAPAPVKNETGNYIPYYDTFPCYFAPKLSTVEVLDKVIADLERAKDLVIQWDTAADNYRYVSSVSYRFTTLSLYVPETGEFFSSRGNRLNFVAINGMLARVCLYAGKYKEAKAYALYVKDTFGPGFDKANFDPEGKPAWMSNLPWFKFGSISTSNPKVPDDILFSLFDNDLLTNIADFYYSDRGYMRLNMKAFDFDSYEDGDDARMDLIEEDEGGKEVSIKWWDTGSTSTSVTYQYKMMPILRLSEIYYVLSECYYKEGDYLNAAKALNDVRNARKAKRMVKFTEDDVSFKKELLWEARKEFMTEGQTYFYYKRLNENIKIGTQVFDMSDKWVFPLPENEEIF